MIFKMSNAQAHCDIPCKIYDPMIAQVAALSVARLVDLLLENESGSASKANQNEFTRLVQEKEVQARNVKSEVNIIWGDYFKSPQIENHPGVHDLVHSIMMCGSKCKQGVDKTEATRLVELVNDFADMFWQTKDVATKRVIAPYPPALAIVQPILADA